MSAADFNRIDRILDALECAKEAHNLLPPLPPGIKPVYVRILDALHRTRDADGSARVSDINKALGFLLPNTTRYLGELNQLKIIEKIPADSDRRVVLVRTTALGEEYIQKFVTGVHAHLQKELASIPENDCIIMIETIRKVYQAMQKVCREERDSEAAE